MFDAIERALPNDPVTLYAIMWNAYVGNASAQGLPGREAEAQHFLDLAIRTSGRLIQLESNDRSLRSFAGTLRQAQSQALTASGDHRAAIAMQRTVIALYRSTLGPERRVSSLSRLAMAQVTMGKIAQAAGDRPLACASYREAREQIDELQRHDALIGSLGSYRLGLDQNLGHCISGAALSEMLVLE